MLITDLFALCVEPRYPFVDLAPIFGLFNMSIDFAVVSAERAADPIDRTPSSAEVPPVEV
jgi:hypothetical protein